MKSHIPLLRWLLLIVLFLGGQLGFALDLTKERPFDPNGPADNKYGLPIPADELSSGTSSLVSPAFAYCRWGNKTDEATYHPLSAGPYVSLSFSYLTRSPFSYKNKDLVLLDSLSNFHQLPLPDVDPAPWNAQWTAPAGTEKGGVLFNPTPAPVDGSKLYMLRKLHFSPVLFEWVSTSNQPRLSSDARKLIIMIHGWNRSDSDLELLSGKLTPPEYDAYAQDPNGAFAKLATALRGAIDGSDWNLVGYHWEADADTGGAIFGGDWVYHNAPEAAENAYQHGYHLGELLKARCPNLESVHFIAHSAGSWAARCAARYLLEKMPGIKIQVTLLDPFIPQIVNSDSKLSTSVMEKLDTLDTATPKCLFRLENYYASDSATGSATKQPFAWRLEDINRRIDMDASGATIDRFNEHSGPIAWLTETVLNPTNDPSGNSSDPGHGWLNSMFEQEPTFVLQPPSELNISSGTTAVLTASAITRAGEGVRYRWYKDDQPLTDGDGGGRVFGATNETLQIDAATESDNGNYVLQATHAGLTTESSTTALTVVISGTSDGSGTSGAPVIVRQPSSKSVIVGGTTTFAVSAGGLPPLTYQWLRNGTAITSATSNSYSLAAASMTDNGAKFSVTVSNSISAVTSGTATLTVTDIPASSSDPYEPNNSSSTAAPIAAGQFARGYVSSPSDVDWFKITVATPGTLNISLSIPVQADYDLELYGPDGAWVVGSYQNAGLSESISYNAAVTGTYYARVYGYPVGNGSFSTTQPYSLSYTLAAQSANESLSVAIFGAGKMPIGFSSMRFSQVSVGFDYTVALMPNGKVVAWGKNDYGQCNIPENLCGVVQIAAGERYVVALKSDGSVVAWGKGSCSIINTPNNASSIVQVVAGYYDAVALMSDGSVVASCNYLSAGGVCGVVQISDDAALKADGTVVSLIGSSNIPAGLHNVIQIAKGAALKSDGTVVTWNGISPPIGLTDVVQIAAGYGYMVALKSNGSVVAWGDNTYGKCDVPSNLSGVVQIAAGSHTVALKADGTIVAWGPKNYNCGYTSEWDYGQCITPTDLSGVVQIAPGTHAGSCFAVSKSDGSVVSWGVYKYGIQTNYCKLDQPDSVANAVQIAMGYDHVIALKSDGSVVGWGSSTWDQCAVPKDLSGVTQVAAGGDGTFALKNDGTVVAWGVGYSHYDYWNGYWTENPVPKWVSGVVQIAAGPHHVLALKSDGTVVAWVHTSGDYGSLCNAPFGLGNVIQVAAGSKHSVALKSDGNIVAWGDNSFGQCSIPVGLSDVVQVAAGDRHTVALRSDGSVVAWGDNTSGQCDIPATLSGVVYIAAHGNETAVLHHSQNPSPFIVLPNLGPKIVANGGSVTFSAIVPYQSLLHFQWQRNGLDIPGATEPSYTISSVTLASDLDRFTVRASDGITSTTSTPALLRVIAGNAKLSALAISSGTLNPAFTSNGTDYTATVANSVTSVTVTPTLSDSTARVQVVGGAGLVVGNNTVSVQVTAHDGMTTKVYTIVVNRLPNPPGTLQFDSAVYSIAENQGSVTLLVTRTGGSGGIISVNYNTSDGSAVAGSDYVAGSGTLTFGIGVTSQQISIPILQDALSEAAESLSVSLYDATGGASIGTQSTATVAILDSPVGYRLDVEKTGLGSITALGISDSDLWQYYAPGQSVQANITANPGWYIKDISLSESQPNAPPNDFQKQLILAQLLNKRLTTVSASFVMNQNRQLSVNFESFNPLAPVVVTGSASGISAGSTEVQGTVIPNTSSATVWFDYGLTSSYGSQSTQQVLGINTNAVAVSGTLAPLTPGRQYHYRIVAANASGTSYGVDRIFTAMTPKPSVTTGTASGIADDGCTLKGTVNPNGFATRIWFDYGLTENYGASTTDQSIGSGTNSLVCVGSISGLAPANTYHYRMVAINDGGTAYGDDQTFTTGKARPSVATGPAIDATWNSVMLTGTVNSSDLVAKVCFDYGTTATYGSKTARQVIAAAAEPQDYAVKLTGLSPATTYHYRADSISTSGTSYGVDRTFTAMTPKPSVTTGTASGIADDGCTLNGTVNPNGFASRVWFDYGLTESYGASTTDQSIGSGTNSLACNGSISGLSPANTYHYRVVAINDGGTAYGDDQTFTTGKARPSVVTGPAIDATWNSVMLTGTVNSSDLVAKVCFDYGTTATYGSKTARQVIAAAAEPQDYAVKLTGLSPATTYHYRADSISNSGTSYGEDKVFVTLPASTIPVSATGDESTGIDGAAFATFGSPAINDDGELALQAFVSGTGVTAVNRSVIWAESGSSRALIARTADLAPGGGVFATLRDPIFNRNAHAAFFATLATGTGGVAAANASGIWATTSGRLTMIARAGNQAPGCAAGTRFSAFSKIVLTDLDQVIFLATLGVTTDNNQGMWVADSHGALKLLVRKGGILKIGTTTKTVLSFSILGSPTVTGGQSRNFNRSGMLTGLVTFTDGTMGIFKLSTSGIASMVAVKNGASPGIKSAKFSAFGNPAINDAGRSAFLASVAGAGISSANNTGIWADSSINRLLIARSGAAAPGVSNGLFSALSDPAYNNRDKVAFFGTLKVGAAGVTTANATGVWSNSSGVLKLIARAQGQAPGCPLGSKFASFSKLVLPDQGGVVFLANLVVGQGGVTLDNSLGLWAVDTAGQLKLIVRKGGTMMVDSQKKIISAISVFQGGSEVLAQSRSFNRQGDLVYQVTFTDGSQGVYKVIFP